MLECELHDQKGGFSPSFFYVHSLFLFLQDEVDIQR